MEGEDVVVDRSSSAGLQDDRSLLPGQVSHDGICEAGDLDVVVASDAVLGRYNAPVSGGRDLLWGSFYVVAAVEQIHFKLL